MAETRLGLHIEDPVDPEPEVPEVNEEVSFDAKSNEFLVNNNVLSNYQHTKHISTTEPLYLDGMAGSDNLVHKPKRSGSQKVAAFGDYLLNDLKTIVAQADLKDDQKADVVGICIGQNPVNGKNVFWNVDSMTNTDTYQFYTSAKFDATKFTTLSKGEGEPLNFDGELFAYVNRDVFGGEKGYIMASAPMSIEDPQPEQVIIHYGEFGGLQNTIEWYKQASAAGIIFPIGSSEGGGEEITPKGSEGGGGLKAVGGGSSESDSMPALGAIMQMSDVESMDDNYNLWFLGSMGHISLLCGEDEPEGSDPESIEKYNALGEAVSKLGKTFMEGEFLSSSFGRQYSGNSVVHCLDFHSGEQLWFDDRVSVAHRLFALIER